MVGARCFTRLVGLMGIAVVTVIVPACSSSWSPQLPWLRRGDSTNVAQRPVYQDAEKKPFLISGYAGAVYGPFPARRFVPGGAPVMVQPSQTQPSVSVSEGSWEPD